jgi:hypothetical protein
MVKTIKVNTDVDTTNYQPIADMSYQDAIHTLLNTPLPGR